MAATSWEVTPSSQHRTGGDRSTVEKGLIIMNDTGDSEHTTYTFAPAAQRLAPERFVSHPTVDADDREDVAIAIVGTLGHLERRLVSAHWFVKM